MFSWGTSGDVVEPASESRERGCLRVFVSLVVGSGLLLGAKTLRPHPFRTQCKSHFFREAPLDFSALLRPQCYMLPGTLCFLVALNTILVRVNACHCCDFMLLFPSGLSTLQGQGHGLFYSLLYPKDCPADCRAHYIFNG